MKPLQACRNEYAYEYLLAVSCKRRHFCPSCHQKRVAEFSDWLCGEVIKTVPHRHIVLTIPKILRRYFLYDRKLLSSLSRCGREALKEYFVKRGVENEPRSIAIYLMRYKKGTRTSKAGLKELRKSSKRVIRRRLISNPCFWVLGKLRSCCD